MIVIMNDNDYDENNNDGDVDENDIDNDYDNNDFKYILQ